MKKYFFALAALVLSASAVFAGMETIPQRARDLGPKINQRHQDAMEGAPAAPAGKPAPAAQPQPPAAPPTPTTAQQSLAKLKADIAAVRKSGKPAPEQKKEFVNDLFAAVRGNSQPSPAAVAKFAGSFLSAVAPKSVALTNDTKVVQAIILSLNSGGLSMTRLSEINDEFAQHLTTAGLTAGDAASVAADLKAVVADIQKNLGR